MSIRILPTCTLTALAGLALVVGLLPGTAAAAPRSVGSAVPVLAWNSCDDGFQCATVHVPLNYRDPRGETISIVVISHRATGPGRDLGWLFFNGGGPEPQISTFPATYQGLPAAWQDRYNIVTFDPRGMGYSTQVRCFPTEAAREKAMGDLPDGSPVDREQEAAYEQAFTKLDTRCARDAGPLLDHDSTADIARDMNLLREAVGAPVLNYYGTLLGATYANLFPATTGRMILDGNINPVAWSTGNSQVPPFSRIGSAQATEAVMTAFLDLCGEASTEACAFSAGTRAATIAKWNTLLRLARRHPVSLGGRLPPRGRPLARATTRGRSSSSPSSARTARTRATSPLTPPRPRTATPDHGTGPPPAEHQPVPVAVRRARAPAAWRPAR